MKIYKEIPFYPNTSDDTHCFQASLKMILKYFYPKEDYSWNELEKATAKVEGLWTWPTAGLLWLQEKGLEVRDIESFDYIKFVQVGGRYLIEEYGEEVGNAQIKYSDLDQEMELAKKFLKTIRVERRIPVAGDIKELLTQDYVVIVNVNAHALNNEEGYVGHFVVIKGFDDYGFILNDPGLPARENYKANFGIFEKAWAYPNKKAKNIIAFKLK